MTILPSFSDDPYRIAYGESNGGVCLGLFPMRFWDTGDRSRSPRAASLWAILLVLVLINTESPMGNLMEGSVWSISNAFLGYWRSTAKSQSSFPVDDSAGFSGDPYRIAYGRSNGGVCLRP